MLFFEIAQHLLHFLVMLHKEEVKVIIFFFKRSSGPRSSAKSSFNQSISSDVDGFFFSPGVSLILKKNLSA